MNFHSELPTFLSSLATSLQHLRMEFSYHNSYVILELVVTTHTFCIALDFLQLGFWNRVVLLQDWNFMVVIINSWIVTVCQSATWTLICSTCHNFPLLFRLPRTWLLWATQRVFVEKRRTLTQPVHPVHAPRF